MSDIVALSGGKDSTALALWLQENEPRDYIYVCTPTGDELPPMIEWWKELGRILGKPILPVTSGRSLGGLIQIERCLPNWRMRFCTPALKIEPFQRFIMQHLPCTIYVGMRADEVRDGGDYSALGSLLVRQRFPFVENGYDLPDVLSYLRCRGVLNKIPERTDCGSCFFQTLWEWYQLWLHYPARFELYCQWEDATGHTLRSESRDSWPASLRKLGTMFALGCIPKERKTMKDRARMCSTCAR